jgi:hypothetical protein
MGGHPAPPPCPLDGVCLTPVPGSGGEDSAGICVSWTTHDRLLFDEGRWAVHSGIMHVMNTARSIGFICRPILRYWLWLTSHGPVSMVT